MDQFGTTTTFKTAASLSQDLEPRQGILRTGATWEQMSCSEIQRELNPKTGLVQWSISSQILCDPIQDTELNWRYRMCVSLRIRRFTRDMEYHTQALAPSPCRVATYIQTSPSESKRKLSVSPLYSFQRRKIISWHRSLHFLPAVRHSQHAGGFIDGDGKTWRHLQVLTFRIPQLRNGFDCLGDCLHGGSDRDLTDSALGLSWEVSAAPYTIPLFLDYEALYKLEMFHRKGSNDQMIPSLLDQWSQPSDFLEGYCTSFICKLFFGKSYKTWLIKLSGMDSLTYFGTTN